ncbi:MAG: ATP-binding protein [Rhodomicrobium sp.]
MISTPRHLAQIHLHVPLKRNSQGFSTLAAGAFRRLLGNAKRAEPLELSQIFIRYALGIVITIYAIVDSATEERSASQPGSLVFMLIVAWIVGLGLLVHLMLWPRSRVTRRTISICTDALALSLLIHYGERSAAIFFPVYLWIILGNGFRFGIGYMYASMAANSICFVIMVLTTPYWRQEWQFSAGLFVAIIAIPIYTSSLISKLRLSMAQARAASAAKSEFLSMISHELRTPLNAILGLAQLSRITAASAQARENAAFTEIAANRLKRMLDSILKFQAIESGAGRVQTRCFDVFDMLSEVEAILAPLARKKKLGLLFRFRTPMPKLVSSDPDIIETIIINLATNAIKYTPSGFVIVELGHYHAMTLRLDVHDSGPGIDPDLQTRIFDKFVRQVPEGTEDEGGVGLGLSLCKSLVELLGGHIGFRSQRGQGSTFWAEFPAGCIQHSKTVNSPADQDMKIVAFGFDTLSHADIARKFQILGGREADSLLADQFGGNPHANMVLIADPSGMQPADQQNLFRLLDRSTAPPPLIAVDAGGPLASTYSRRATAVASSAGAISPQLVHTAVNWHRRHLFCQSKSPEAPAHGKRTILVADDNAMNRQVTGQMLKLDGYAVLDAETGDEALEQLLTRQIDVALLDVNLADQDGVEICNTYRSVAARDSAAVLVGLTADISKETRDRCLAAGMLDVLTKPLALEDLRSLLARINSNAPAARRTSPHEEEKEVFPILDIERVNHLIELFGEHAFRNDFLATFEAETCKSVERLKAEISLLQSGGAQKVLHAIKSSARTIGALRLARHVSSLEDLQFDHTQPASYESIAGELSIFMNTCKELLNHERFQASPTIENAGLERRPRG